MTKLQRRMPLLALLPLAAACVAEPGGATSADAPEPLFNQIEYRFVGGRGEVDEAQRVLTWEATIDGDLAGEGRWYFVQPAPVTEVAHAEARVVYYEARWEIRVDGQIALAGRSAGKTVMQDAGPGIWDGSGVVTEAAPPYEAYIGRSIYETGPVIMDDESSDGPWGRGLFVIH